ncbi:hypothetical protein MKEN_01463200 [Mycena kentingensis (nom. inval.)]|nr:hypothetical protein MKEN_01463200 [Mycena kentingensis (nom. inval.)]
MALSESHPLQEELSSLRAAVARFQTEAHASALKLQRLALDTTTSTDRVVRLEAENALLQSELAVLRENPLPAADSDVKPKDDAIAELTLSLRRLNSKLSLSEEALAMETKRGVERAVNAREETMAAEEAFELAARARRREDEGRQSEARLERELEVAREETRARDHVIEEYANLVRMLEGRSPATTRNLAAASTATLVENGDGTPKDLLHAQQQQLVDLASTWETQARAFIEQLQTLEAERDKLNARLNAARAVTQELGEELAKSKMARETARIDDTSAAGMVERYMKFTQQTTLTLHTSLTSLRTRHAATTHTLSSQLSSFSTQLAATRADNERLRTALDEAGGALVRETVGRRREVGIRMRLVAREEALGKALRDALARAHDADALVEGVRAALEVLDASDAGTEGRMVLLENAVQMLVAELEEETRKRVELEKIARLEAAGLEQEPLVVDERAKPEMVTEDVSELETAVAPTADTVHAPTDDAILSRPVEADQHDRDETTPTIFVDPPVKQAPPPPNEPIPSIPSNALPPMSEPAAAADVAVAQPAAIANGPSAETSIPAAVHPPAIQAPAEGTEVSVTAVDGPRKALMESEDDSRPPMVSIDAVTPLENSNDVPPSSPPRVEPREDPRPPIVPISAVTLLETLDDVTVSSPPPIALPDSSIPPDAPVAFPSLSPTVEDVLRTPPASQEVLVAFPTPPATVVNPLPTKAPSTRHKQHPVLASLTDAGKRYDELQTAFRACHSALEELRARVGTEDEVIRVALDRLHDYLEDARVELEICVADGEVLRKGWEAIVLVGGDAENVREQEDVQRQIDAFVEKETRAQRGFRRKLADVEHDMGVLRRRMERSVVETTIKHANGAASPLSASPSSASFPTRPASPYAYTAPSPGEAATFGSVMTSPRVLRRESSITRLSLNGAAGGNPFEGLGLRVPMPAFVHPHSPTTSVASPGPSPRQRTISGVYMLGLGSGVPVARRPSGLGLGIGGMAGRAGTGVVAVGDGEAGDVE